MIQVSARAKALCAALVGASFLAAPVSALAWTKSFVVEWFEPAFYYGAKEGDSAPGSDCPAGSNPENNWKDLLKTSYRSAEEVAKIMDPEHPQITRYGGIRGPKGEDVYKMPWTVADPGLTPVSGKVAYGFDLDGNPKTGFASPEGKTGIDNRYYYAAGCWVAWRGPARGSHHAKYVNDGMRDGVLSVVMVFSGQGADPANDADVKVGFYLARDKMVKDANGQIARDYTFRINPDPRFQSVARARTVNGVVEGIGAADLQMRDVETAPFFPPQLTLLKSKLRFEPAVDGSMTGMIGGYRPIDQYYIGWAAAGSTHELTTHINMPGYWYALHREADYAPDPKTGKNTAISTAYRFYLTPAFVVEPKGQAAVAQAALFEGPVDPAIGLTRFPQRPPADAAPKPDRAAATSSPEKSGG